MLLGGKIIQRICCFVKFKKLWGCCQRLTYFYVSEHNWLSDSAFKNSEIENKMPNKGNFVKKSKTIENRNG